MDSQSIPEWLAGIHLNCYASNFETAGYFDLAQCISLTEEDLDSIGITPPGHRKRILTHLPDVDVLLCGDLVPPPPPPSKDAGREYVNIGQNGAPPVLPPKRVSDRPVAIPSRPKPAPRIRKSQARSRTESDLNKEAQQQELQGSPSTGDSMPRKKPVPQPRPRLSPQLKQDIDSSGSTDSLSVSDDNKSLKSSGDKNTLAKLSDVNANLADSTVTSVNEDVDDPNGNDIEFASNREMEMFKIDIEGQMEVSEEKTENDFLRRLSEIERQIRGDLLDLERESSDESDADNVVKMPVSAAALSGSADSDTKINKETPNTFDLNKPVPIPGSFAQVGSKVTEEESYDVPKSLQQSQKSYDAPNVPPPPLRAVPAVPVPSDIVTEEQSYDVPATLLQRSTEPSRDIPPFPTDPLSVAPPVPTSARPGQLSYDVPSAAKREAKQSYDIPNVPPVPFPEEEQSYDVPPSLAEVRKPFQMPPVPVPPLPKKEEKEPTYNVPSKSDEEEVYEPIWHTSSQGTKPSSQTLERNTSSGGGDSCLPPPLPPMPHTLPKLPVNRGPVSFPPSAASLSFTSNQDSTPQSILGPEPPVSVPGTLPEAPKPIPVELKEFDPLEEIDTSFIRSAKRLEETTDEDLYDAPPPSRAPPPLPAPTRRPPPPVPPRGMESLNTKKPVVENDYIEGSFDEFTKMRAGSGESTRSSSTSRSSMPLHSPPPVPIPTPTRRAPPPAISDISEEYHLLEQNPFDSDSARRQRFDTPTGQSPRLESEDGFSTDDNISLSDGGEFMEESDDLATVTRMVDVKPVAKKRIPITNQSNQRTIERSGFLYKQDSAQKILASSWTKRWVVFNGDDLRYYEEKKSMVSKRIIPVAIMRNVENEIKQGDSKPYRFKLKTIDRIYIFAADKTDDLFLWTNTLMEAIITSQSKGLDNQPEGLGMNSPDREGFLKMDGMKGKIFVAIKGDKLCYYNTKQDFKVGSPIHQVDMKLCAVKEPGKNKLQLMTNYKTFSFLCDSIAEAHMWKKAIEDSIAEGLSDTRVVEQVYEEELNRFCADCDASDPSWASINLGIVMCKRCAGIHRQLHTPASKVRSLKLDTKVWTPTVIKIFHVIGNRISNEFWAGAIQSINKISPESDDLSRQQYIEDKYQSRKYCKFHPLKDNMEVLDEMLCQVAQSDNVDETMRLIFSGANMTYMSDKYGEPMTSLQLAKKAGKTLQAEFLYHNGAEVEEKVTPGRRNSDNYRRRIVCHKGYLFKTGGNQKDFLKRWCVLEHCSLSYYADEKSNTAKDSIESKDMISISVAKSDRQDFAFELGTTKYNGRVYLFGAESEEARQEWMRKIAQSFSPSDAISLITDFTRGGYVFLQDGAAATWEQCWLQLRGKELSFLNKALQQFDSVDLRKLIRLKQYDENGCAECFEKGFHFVLDFPGRAWYIQADALSETEAWFSVIQKFAKESGETLTDQQLTSEDIPIIVDKCIAFIAANGLQLQGIYRLNGTHSKINKLLQDFHDDARAVLLKLEETEVHDVANCLKRFFRTLSDPLLTQELHPEWVRAASLTDHDSKLQFYRFYLSKLPMVNYNTLRKVILHLNSVSEHDTVNKMSISNLASIFGPALMVADQDENVGYRSTNHEIACLVDLITYHEWLFEIKDTERDVEEKILEAQKKIERAQTVKGQGGHIMIPIYVGKKANDKSYNERIPATMTSRELVEIIVRKEGLSSRNWVLYEVICNEELERVIHYNEKVLPVLMNWSNWDSEYSATSYLCVKENRLYDKLDLVLDPTLSLFSELKLSEKKSFKKFYFEFKQSKLAYYKSAQASNPQGSWNVEDLIIYQGAESKRSAPTNWCITFIKANEKVIKSKDCPFFGRTMSCLGADDMYRWLASMISAQHPEGLFPPQPLTHTRSAPPVPSGATALHRGPPPSLPPPVRGKRVLPDLSELQNRLKKS